jgi:pre-rRNA-processing protein TSR1
LRCICHHAQAAVAPVPLPFQDPLAIVDLAKAAEVLLLLLPGQEGAVTVDAAGSSCLTVLRAMGLPSTIAVVLNQQQHGTNAAAADAMGIDGEDEPAAGGAAAAKGSSAELKRRSAAKKRAEKALQQHLPGDTKLLSGDNTQDMQQLLRTLADSMPQLPVWRRQRPYIMVQQASFQLNEQQQQQQQQDGQQQQQQQQLGQLRLTGYVRAQGLSANQLITVPGAGDFRILRIEGPHDPAAAVAQQRQQQHKKGGAAGAMDMDMQDGAGAAAGPVLALPDPEQQEALVRENEPDPLDGEYAGLRLSL